ncbi:MAG: hypothetical protein ACP5KF_06265, partial [Sulfurihydrogenibium sp.]
VKTDYNRKSDKSGDGYSINVEVRPVKDWSIFARYDHWKPNNKQDIKDSTKDANNNPKPQTIGSWDKRNAYYVGIAYKWNKYVKWIVSYINYDYKDVYTTDKFTRPASPKDTQKYMITAELSW